MEGAAPREFIDKQELYFKALNDLIYKGGLEKARVMELACVWSNGSCVHIQRALPPEDKLCREVDKG